MKKTKFGDSEKKKMSLISPELKNFEKRRRTQETKNEIILTVIIFVGLSVGLIVIMLEIIFKKMSGVQSSFLLIIPFFIGIIASGGIISYLKHDPPYYPQRKYILTSFGLIMNFLSMLFLRTNVPYASLSFIPIASYVLLIVLSGLRYDLIVVVFAGFVSFGLHLFFLFCMIPIGSYTLPSAISTFIILGAATASITYVVSSILSLHVESIWKDRLAQFLAPEVVREISDKPELLHQRTEKYSASILFVDIRGFTTLCENSSSSEIGEILNIFLEEMTLSIIQQRGMIDKYVGDSIMGVFGIPVVSSKHAIQATRAAIDMYHRLKRVNSKLAQKGYPQLSVGIGIHTGEVVAGTVGSSQRLEYTVIGDTVNVASRIEALTKKHTAMILIYEQTRKGLDGSIPLRKITTTRLRGRKKPVVLWSPIIDETT